MKTAEISVQSGSLLCFSLSFLFVFFIFFGKMISIKFKPPFCNALFCIKAQRGKIKPVHFQFKEKESAGSAISRKQESIVFVALPNSKAVEKSKPHPKKWREIPAIFNLKVGFSLIIL
jgi:hypothetical protein